jgi:hypothetical protein
MTTGTHPLPRAFVVGIVALALPSAESALAAKPDRPYSGSCSSGHSLAAWTQAEHMDTAADGRLGLLPRPSCFTGSARHLAEALAAASFDS